MDFMSKCKDKEFDLAIVDPPYGINIKKIWGDEKYGYKKYTNKEWDNKRPDKMYFDELYRITKNQIIWGANYFVEYLKPSMGWILWDKGQRDFAYSDGELAYTSFNKALRIFTYSRSLSNFKEKKIHITQKPIDLYKWLLKNYAKPRQTIFDSHVGSGSIRIACYDMGFDFTGCELDPDYFEAQEKRFKDHISQNELFEKSELQELMFDKTIDI